MLCLLRCDWGDGRWNAKNRRLQNSLQRPATERPPTWQQGVVPATLAANRAGATLNPMTTFVGGESTRLG